MDLHILVTVGLYPLFAMDLFICITTGLYPLILFSIAVDLLITITFDTASQSQSLEMSYFAST